MRCKISRSYAATTIDRIMGGLTQRGDTWKLLSSCWHGFLPRRAPRMIQSMLNAGILLQQLQLRRLTCRWVRQLWRQRGPRPQAPAISCLCQARRWQTLHCHALLRIAGADRRKLCCCEEAPVRPPHPLAGMLVPRLMQVWLHHTEGTAYFRHLSEQETQGCGKAGEKTSN